MVKGSYKRTLAIPLTFIITNRVINPHVKQTIKK